MSSFYKTDDNAATAVFPTDPGGSWVPVTEAEYDALTATFPNPRKDDVAVLATALGLTGDALAALYRLFGQDNN